MPLGYMQRKNHRLPALTLENLKKGITGREARKVMNDRKITMLKRKFIDF